MPRCNHCGQEVPETTYCSECGKNYCSLHKDPVVHECNLVKEYLGLQPSYTPTQHYTSVPEDSSYVRGVSDGSFTWYRQERLVPRNAFDRNSGIKFKGILFPYKSEALHFFIGSALIFLIGFIGFYNPILIELNLEWAIFMLAGFYTTAFLFHEFGHRQTAKHFGLQTKFRLLTFGMALTGITLILGILSVMGLFEPFPSLALPGAVVVLGLDKIDRKTGLCKAAGPIVNLIYGIILLTVSFVIPRTIYPLNLFIGYAAVLNFTLGLFNMIPVGVLDGHNIIRYNKLLYCLLLIPLLFLLIITYSLIYAPPQTSLYYPEGL